MKKNKLIEMDTTFLVRFLLIIKIYPRVPENFSVFPTETKSDSIFQLGVPPCTEKIEARSRVLSSGSPVFRAMLEGPLAQDRIITITDVDPRAFEILIRYIGWGILRVQTLFGLF